MRYAPAFLVAVFIVMPTAWGSHPWNCWPGGADPDTYAVIVFPEGTTLYFEERSVPTPAKTSPPIPGSGFVFADGTWIYQESNGVAGLQRGGTSYPCLPAEDPCVVTGIDPINDENCGHGPDTIRFGLSSWFLSPVPMPDLLFPCRNGIDDDLDGRTDWWDPGCDSADDPSERRPDVACDDGADNDGDLRSDYPLDPGCQDPEDTDESGEGLPAPHTGCDDGLDDDLDGRVDYPSDPGCAGPADSSEHDAALPCDDGADNDGDASRDFPSDPGCTSLTDGSELNPGVACDDGVDNDGDGWSDYAPGSRDVGCSSSSDVSEGDPNLVCDDGLDNDGDGVRDYPADPGCSGPLDPSERTVP